ncbi:MAG: carbohydrate ABC transporter permease [Firmicutes bacterium]|jgi:multiple sugar transport system permease protein|nr:carbohydrate ABC transporter permease [Bacillota bacterium]
MSVVIGTERKSPKYRIFYSLLIIVLSVGVIIQVFPLIWMVASSVKDSSEIFQMPPRLFAKNPNWHTYKDVLSLLPVSRYFLNSIIRVAGVIALQVSTSALAAYALSHSNLPGKKGFLLFFLGTMMIPFEIILIPTFLLLKNMGLINTFWGIILPFTAWGWSLFLLKGFFDGIPKDLLDAARIDGASEFHIFARIIVPLSKPVLAVVTLMTFLSVWNDFLFPFVVAPQEKMWVLMVAVFNIQNSAVVPWNQIMALLSLCTIPLLLVFLFCQRYIVEGITMTGLKG